MARRSPYPLAHAFGFVPPPMPDAVMPPTLSGVENRQPTPISGFMPAALGFAPPAGQTVENAMGPQSPEEAERLARGGRMANMGFEVSGLGPLRRAGLHAAEGRVLPALGNAGVAMMPYRPLAGLGMLGGAYGGALGADLLGAAQPTSPAAAQAPPPEEDGLNTTQRRRRDFLTRRLQRLGNRMPEPEQEELTGLNAITADFVRARNAATIGAGADRQRQEQTEYNQAVQRAEQAFAAEMARDRRFSETNVGRLFEETGGLAPFGFGALAGGLSRAATGGGRNLLYNYTLPVASGALAGVSAANVPLAYNALFTEPDNPLRRAYEARGRELPRTHPQRQEALDYAATLPTDNPVRREAADQLYDPTRFAERTALGAAEGVLGGLGGAELVRIPSRLAGWLGGRGPTPPPPPAGPPAPLGPSSATPPVARLGPRPPPPPSPETPPPAPGIIGAPPRPMPPGAFQARNGRWMVMTPSGPRFISEP